MRPKNKKESNVRDVKDGKKRMERYLKLSNQAINEDMEVKRIITIGSMSVKCISISLNMIFLLHQFDMIFKMIDRCQYDLFLYFNYQLC